MPCEAVGMFHQDLVVTKKLLGTSALLVVTSATLLVTNGATGLVAKEQEATNGGGHRY